MRLSLTIFSSMVERICRLCSWWKHSHLSPEAKTVLINPPILSIPTYYSLVYHIPNSILKEITRLLRSFFWYKDGNGKGIHVVAWDSITTSKTEEGLAIKNLSIAKQFLMAKNAFKFLNGDGAFWVQILSHKYGSFNFWRDSVPFRCSWFFRCLSQIAFKMKPFRWMNSVNPNCSFFLFDP